MSILALSHLDHEVVNLNSFSLQAPLETWEIVQIMEVLDKNEEGKINLRKLSNGIQEKKFSNKKKDMRAKAEERRKKREERRLLNPEMSTGAANSVRDSSSIAGSLPSNSNTNSRRLVT